MTRLLVTGANGFVGGALTEELIARGFDVTAATRRPANIAKARPVVIGEIGPATDWRDALAGVQTLFHLAGVAHSGIADDAAIAARYEAVNVQGSIALARQAAAAGVKRLVFMSSIKVNGEQAAPDAPYRESDVPAPQDIYGRSKRDAEAALRAIGRETGLEIVVLRSPLVHGPGARGNLANLLALCDSPWPLPFGALTGNRRSLVARANLIDALALAASHPAAAGEIFLLRDGDDLSTAALVRTLRRALGRPERLLPVPAALLAGAARLAGKGALADRLTGSLCVDDGKLRRLLGWRPVVSAEAGLAQMAAAFRRA